MGDMERTAAITAIHTLRRDPGRVSIRVAGRVAAVLPRPAADDLGLVVGRAWDEHLAAAVAAAVDYDKAMRAATRMLARRALSRRQLHDRLASKSFDPGTIDRVCDRLEETGVMNDQAFGRALVQDLRARRPAGKRLLQARLRQRGVDRHTIEQVIGEAEANSDPVGDARRLAEGRLRTMGRLEPLVQKRRLWGLLARRGFDPETIEAALAALRLGNG